MYGEFSQEENIANPRPNADVDYRHLGGKQQNNANFIDEYALYANLRKTPSFSYGDTNQYRGAHGNSRLGRTCKSE